MKIIKNLKNKNFLYITKRFKIHFDNNMDDIENIQISPDIQKSIEERKLMLEAQEREELRRAFEFTKRREVELKKGNRKMLLDTQIPNVTEKPEKY